MADRIIIIGKTDRHRKFPSRIHLEKNRKTAPKGVEKEGMEIPKCLKEEVLREIKEEVPFEIAPDYEVIWDENNKHIQAIKIRVSNKDFLKAILEMLNRNLRSETKFEWSPLVWCEDPEHSTVNAMVKNINENNMTELEIFIDKIMKDLYGDD